MIDRLVIAWEMGQRGEIESESKQKESAQTAVTSSSVVCSIENLLLSHGSAAHYHIMALAPYCTRQGETVNSDTARRRKMGSAYREQK